MDRIIQIKPRLESQDSDAWGFTHHGVYTTQSAYKLLNSIKASTSSEIELPLIEKQLWKHLWKLKTPPKIRHFPWRALSGALAVGDRLRSRGINVDPSCSLVDITVKTFVTSCFTVLLRLKLGDLLNYSSHRLVSLQTPSFTTSTSL